MYQPDDWEIVSEINSVVSITIVSLIFGRKVASIDGPVYYFRGLLLALYSLIWAFHLIACMLVSTNNANNISCQLSFYNCVIIYTAAKMVLFLYFVEKIYIISVPTAPRYKSWWYRGGIVLLLPYFGLMALLIVSQNTSVAAEVPFHCTIGYKLMGSIPTLCYELFIAALCTGIFIKFYAFPNARQQKHRQAESLRIMAKRKIVASVTACVTSTVNYLIIIGYKGQLRGLTALSVATLNLTIICCVMHWATSHGADVHFSQKALESAAGEVKPIKLEIKQHQEVVVLTEVGGRPL